MADSFLTLLDITKQNGTDLAVGLVEEVRTFAPEVNVLMGRPIIGTSYKSAVRQTLPLGPAFRGANVGSDVISSKYDQRLNECFFLDGQMQIDEAIVESGEFAPDLVLSREALGVMKQKSIALGSQFYYGTAKDAKGFQGLQDFVDSSMVVDAGGAGGSSSSAYLVVNTLDGVHFIFGNNTGLNINQWMRQQVRDANSKAFFAWVNNLSGWVGLSLNYSKSVARIKGIDSTHSLTDALVAQALALFPVGTLPTHLFCNRNARYLLQKSRSAVTTAITAATPLVFAPTPTESNGIPLHVTDSIVSTE